MYFWSVHVKIKLPPSKQKKTLFSIVNFILRATLVNSTSGMVIFKPNVQTANSSGNIFDNYLGKKNVFLYKSSQLNADYSYEK